MSPIARSLCLLLVLATAVSLGAYGPPVGRWTHQPVLWLLNPANAEGFSAEAVEATAQAAAARWNTIPGVAFQFVYGGRTTSLGGWPDNVVRFSADYAYPYAETAQGFYNGEMFSATTTIYTSRYTYYLGSTGCAYGGAYLEDILVHEFGHMAGLSHSAIAGATMYPMVQSCTTTQRTIEADDVAVMWYLYPDTTFNWAPAVAITSPLPSTVIAPGTLIALVGTATDREDGSLLDEIEWTSSIAGYLGYGATIQTALPAGVQSLTARVVDSGGAVGVASIVVTVAAPLTVTITAPQEGSTVAHHHDLSIKATATSTTGPVQRVEFFVNGTLTCTDTTSAYACKWRVPAPIGTVYTLRAVAYDSVGSIGTSADLHVTSK